MKNTYNKNFQHFKHFIYNIDNISPYFINKPSQSSLVHSHTDYSLIHWESSYRSKLSLLNLNYLKEIDVLENSPCFLVRDGLFLTMDFFNRCIKSKELRATLLFHNAIRNFIPEEWMENVLFYEFEFKQRKPSFNFSQNKSLRLIIKFHLLEKCFQPQKILDFLDTINFYEEIVLCFSIHDTNHFFSNEWDGGKYSQTTFSIIEEIKKKCLLKANKVSLRTLKSLQENDNLSGFDYFNLSQSEHYYIDDFTNYHCLSYGANPLNVQSFIACDEDLFIPLSSNHGIRVLANLENQNLEIGHSFQENLKYINIKKGDKFNLSAFQMLHSLTMDNTGFSWPKIFN
jgi:hypothetical protein